ncbi:hypothetical protein TIFTF001_033661 [Ficus carica]|uniref:Uncharacterized protein n=1 Tax=Ficus carica TaxID=3494 RepID=A0AA88DZ70_FICCA|nr:hypothetical protein TIFTF001_033661 [Ficus carica]
MEARSDRKRQVRPERGEKERDSDGRRRRREEEETVGEIGRREDRSENQAGEKWFRQQHPMRSGISTNTHRSLRRRSPAKWKHLGMMGTPVWCLPWALRSLSVLSGPGCSGRPGRVGCLGYPVDSEQQDAMGVTSKGATVPVRAGDRRMVVSDADSIGARLVSAMKEDGWSKRPILVLALLPGSSRNVVGVLDNKQLPGRRTVVPRVACVSRRWCHVALHHGREGKAALRILKLQTSNSNGKLAGSPIAASKTAPGFYARPSSINSEGQSAFATIAYENSSFCRELPKTAEDYQAKDQEDQHRQLPRR